MINKYYGSFLSILVILLVFDYILAKNLLGYKSKFFRINSQESFEEQIDENANNHVKSIRELEKYLRQNNLFLDMLLKSIKSGRKLNKKELSVLNTIYKNNQKLSSLINTPEIMEKLNQEREYIQKISQETFTLPLTNNNMEGIQSYITLLKNSISELKNGLEQFIKIEIKTLDLELYILSRIIQARDSAIKLRSYAENKNLKDISELSNKLTAEIIDFGHNYRKIEAFDKYNAVLTNYQKLVEALSIYGLIEGQNNVIPSEETVTPIPSPPSPPPSPPSPHSPPSPPQPLPPSQPSPSTPIIGVESWEKVDPPPSSDGLVEISQERTVSVPEKEIWKTDKNRWLQAHNFYRSKHCSPPLEWDDRLAKLAEDWAKNLASQRRASVIPHPSTQTEKSKYLTVRDSSNKPCCNNYNGLLGQNLAYGPRNISTNSQVYNKEIEDVVSDWYEEVNLPNYFQPSIRTYGGDISFNPNLENRIQRLQSINNQYRTSGAIPENCPNKLGYKYNQSPNCNPTTGHMTQIVWKDSTKVGCAKVKAAWNTDTYIWACNYNPPGNVYGWNESSTLDSFNKNVQNPNTCL